MSASRHLRPVASLWRSDRLATLAIAVLLVVGSTGCSTYASRATKLRHNAVAGKLDASLELLGGRELDANALAKEDDVLLLLERGLVLYHEGRYRESIAAFQRADQRIDDLYTKSVTEEALAFLTNDGTLPYTGYPAEQVLLHTYAALAYMALGEDQAALVETRATSEQLARMESLRDEKKGYSDDGFAEWLAAMLYADDGDGNACLVSCRRALAAFEEARELWGQSVPADFLHDYARWARRFGFPEEAETLADSYGESFGDGAAVPRGYGEVVLLYESGFVDHLAESRVDFPIFENDERDDDERYARRVIRRGSRGNYVATAHPNAKIDYWLSVALPVVVRTEPVLRSARMQAAGVADHSEVVQDVSAVFRLTFEEGAGKRLLRTVLRGIAKYATVQAVKNGKDGKKNDVAGFLANVIASATERADTRSWSMLPDTIQMARLTLPVGVHTVEVEVLDSRNQVAQTATFEAVEVFDGRRTILHHRSFR